MNFEVLRNKAYDKKQILEDIQKQETLLAQKKADFEVVCRVQLMLQQTANRIQNTLKIFINGINQQALDIAFPGYTFNMEFSTKNNVSHAGIYVENHGRRQKPMDSNGGGLGNIIAICSQMGAKKMSHTRNVIMADQPMKDLSKGNKEELAMEMLKTLTSEMKLQYIMISHIDSQIDAADKTINVKIEYDDDLGYPVSKVV
jgi:DNA repair exonuclease SbcCD ATPase subunit